ncbi:MAG: hypothetical protein V4592_04890 [Bacteroidota bacterium]
MHYNSFQYSARIWLSTALAVPHIYILYFFASRGISAYLPMSGYLILLFECLLLSIPVWLLFWVAMDVICQIKTTLFIKKLIALGVLEGLMFLLYFIIIYGFGSRATTWSSCFDFMVISGVTIAVSVFFYQLYPLKSERDRFRF